MNKENIIKSELDDIMELIANNSFKIQQVKYYSPFLKSVSYNSRKELTRPRVCIYPNCKSLSVKRSHSIAKSNSLKTIADKGHLLQPVFNDFGNTFKLSMESIGINNASTFPGFCKKHKKLFQPFESQQNFNEDEFIQLQAYRAICREIVFLDIEIEIINKTINEYRNKIEDEALSLLTKNLRNKGITSEPQRFTFKGRDEIIYRFQNMKNNFKSRLIYLKNSAGQILHDFNNKIVEGERKTVSYGVSVDYKIPISLCGYTALAYGEKSNKMLFATNIIPMENSTYVFCFSDREHNELFHKIVGYYFQSPLTILSFVESFMIHNCDHWFINPSYWNTFSKQKQEMILAEILNMDKLITDEFEYSIFDDIRKKVLSEYEKHKDELSEVDYLVINKEKNKLTNLKSYVPPTENQLIESMEKYWNNKLINYN